MFVNSPDLRLRTPKRVRDYNHDMMPVEIPARNLIAGDLVPGLGVLDAVLDTGGGTLLLCAGETAWERRPFDEIAVNGAMCKVCDMHPDDCAEWGCGWGPLDGNCHCGQPVAYGYDGNPLHSRGLCSDCDLVRCDAYPGACGYHNRDSDPIETHLD